MADLIADPPLSFGVSLDDTYKVKRVKLGDGYSQRSADGINHVCQRWRLVWSLISYAQAEAVRAFFRGLGGTTNFTWTPPGQSTPIKLIATGNPNLVFNGFNNVNLSVDTEQVFDA